MRIVMNKSYNPLVINTNRNLVRDGELKLKKYEY